MTCDLWKHFIFDVVNVVIISCVFNIENSFLDLTLSFYWRNRPQWSVSRSHTGSRSDTNSFEQSPSCVANRFSPSQAPRILQKLMVHHHSHKSPLPIRRPEDLYLILSPIYARGFQVVSFPQVSPPKPCVHLSSGPYVLRALPVSFDDFRDANSE